MTPGAGSWRALASRGYASLSSPEVEHAMLELPAERSRYVRVLQDIGDYPGTSVLGQRIPDTSEIENLNRLPGRWRAIALLDDDRALRVAAGLFQRLYVLDPFYDVGGMLYAAWHDAAIRDEHARGLARHAGLLVRAAPLFEAGTAVLAPDHLPGSWNPRPGWRKPKSDDDPRQRAAWTMRTGLVLLYWADRLDAVVCVSQAAVTAVMEVALGERARSAALRVREPPHVVAAQTQRDLTLQMLQPRWRTVRRASRRRTRRDLADVADRLAEVADAWAIDTSPRQWHLTLGEAGLPDPALLIRRVLNGDDPQRWPPLARRTLRRRSLTLVPGRD